MDALAVLRSRVDTSDLPPLHRFVAERVALTTADVGWIGDLVCVEEELRAVDVASAPLITDVRMLAEAVAPHPAIVGLAQPGVAELAAAEGITRSAAGIRLAAERFPDGAVWAVGNAPTALFEILRLASSGQLRPSLVIGVPVGFVGAADSKAALRRSGLPAVSTRSERGGAAIAAAVIHALVDFH
ncbi:precorrin-8X methylmutase [Pseudonocardiaceae bacterium YIM PH 21723]|nr:precorrin-8X methylmutase [Pseudonocardiaceae bacterium YIM PH 21723]